MSYPARAEGLGKYDQWFYNFLGLSGFYWFADFGKKVVFTLRPTSPVVGSHLAGRFTGRFCQVFLGTRELLQPRLLPTSGGGWVYCLALEAPLIRRMTTGPKVFLAMLETGGICPATGPSLKRPCATFVLWWDER